MAERVDPVDWSLCRGARFAVAQPHGGGSFGAAPACIWQLCQPSTGLEERIAWIIRAADMTTTRTCWLAPLQMPSPDGSSRRSLQSAS